MEFHQGIRLALFEGLQAARARNPSYSMRAYARKVGIPQSAISELLSGKRLATKKMAAKILQGLEKDPAEVERMLEPRSEAEQSAAYRSLDVEIYRLISDWHYYAILSLLETRGARSDPAWLAKRLSLPLKTAMTAVETLIALNLLRRNEAGILKPTGERLSALSSRPNIALRKANRENLHLAEKALEEVPVEDRDFSALTFSFDPARMEEARKMIAQFRRNFDRVMEAGPKKEVYKICIQLFPLTKKEDA